MTEHTMQAIVLAAGKSTRFNTGNTKLLEKICGQETVAFSTKLLEALKIPTTVVVGYQKELIQDVITKHHGDKVSFVVQQEQLGTGHALAYTRNTWNADHILIMNADAPLVTDAIIKQLYEKHVQSNAALSFVTAHNIDPSLTGYGRVIKHENGTKIIEARDYKGQESEHCCINAGIYLAKRSFLEKYIDKIEKSDVTQEFYITDLVNIADENKEAISTIVAPFDRIRGVNTLQELWATEQIKRGEIIRYWMHHGVRFAFAQNVYIDLSITIGAGTSIGCGVHLLGSTIIGKNCTIHDFSALYNTTVEDDAIIRSHCIIKKAHIGQQAEIGPFAHIKNNSIIGKQAIVGNFVEINNSSIGNRTKAKHLTYIGNTTVGNDVNIGAGTITCNYDGFSKHKTIIEDGAFVGSNNTIVAPVKIGEKSYTAAGSVITKDVPKDALGIGRSRQTNKDGYAQVLRERAKQRTEKKATIDSSASGLSFMGARKTHEPPTTSEQS